MSLSNSNPGGVLLLILALLSTFGPLSIDMYLPGLPSIADELGASAAQVQMTLSAFLIGFAVGQLIYGPLSDRFGRKPVLVNGLLLYVITSALCALSSDIDMLTAARFLHALGGGSAIVVSRAIVRDHFATNQSAKVLSTIFQFTALAPMAAPIIGGYVLEAFDWRMIFWVLTGFGALTLLIALLGLTESNPADRRQGIKVATAFKRYGEVLRNRAVVAYMMAGGFIYAGMFAYITGTPFVYIEYFQVAPEHYGYLFGLNVVAILIASRLNLIYVGRLGARTMMLRGVALSLMAGLLLALFATLISLGAPLGMLFIVVPLFFFLGPISIVGANSVALATAEYPQAAGAVAAICGALQFGFGALSGLLLGLFDNGTPLVMCLIIGSCGVLAMVAMKLTTE